MKIIKSTKRIISVMLLSLLTFLLFFSSSILLDSVAKEQNENSDADADIVVDEEGKDLEESLAAVLEIINTGA